MSGKQSFVALLSALFFLSNYLFADLALTTLSGTQFTQGNYVVQIPVYAHRSGATPTTLSIGGFLSVTSGSGAFVNTTPGNNADQDVFNWSAGEFNANVVAGGSVSEVTTPPNEAAFSIEFSAGQAFGDGIGNRDLLGFFNYDITGMGIGNYTLDFLAGQENADVPISSIDGSFQITAVPEPSSILTAVGLGYGGLFYRRRRRKVSSAVVASLGA